MALTKITGEGVGAVDDLTVNRSGNGVAQTIQNSGSTVGAIGIADGDNLYIASDDTNDVGLKFNGDGNRIQPCDASGASRDNAIDLGEAGSSRFKDLYLGGVVQIEGSTRRFKIEQDNYGLRIADVDAGSAERLRIDAAGKVRIGNSSGVYTEQFLVQSDTSSVNPMTVNNTRSSAATDYAIIFGRNGSIVGSIQTSLSATSYATSSDYRLKTNVSYDWDATSRLKQLKPARFDWISEGDDAITVDGFLAHEAQAVVPEAVTGDRKSVV